MVFLSCITCTAGLSGKNVLAVFLVVMSARLEKERVTSQCRYKRAFSAKKDREANSLEQEGKRVVFLVVARVSAWEISNSLSQTATLTT